MEANMLMHSLRTSTALLLFSALVFVACGDDDDDSPTGPGEGTWVDLFPVPVSAASSPFSEVDDGARAVPFTDGFRFEFYGTRYDTVYLNTNGGFTFGSGESEFDPAAGDIQVPGVGVFWGDMNPAAHGAENRASQMRYRQYSDRFVIAYEQLQDNDEAEQNNTATVTLYRDGRIVIDYGEVLSTDVLVGVWDGTHTDDRHVGVQSSYSSYATTGTGTVVWDYWGDDDDLEGQLDDRTLTFDP
jgi:hypothetical protein